MFIKRPGGLRKSFSLVGGDGKTLYDERIDKVNKDLHSGTTIDLLEMRMREIRDSLKPQVGVLGKENIDLVLACHRAKVKKKGPHLRDKYSALSRLKRILPLLGSRNLLSMTEDEILDCFEEEDDEGRLYHLKGAVNELMAFAGRPIHLFNPAPPIDQTVRYIRAEVFMGKASIDNPLDLYLGSLFATGCRLGELPPAVLGTESIHIAQSLSVKGRLGPTKNKKARTSPVLPPLVPFIMRLNALGEEVRASLYLSHRDRIRKRCRALYGVTPHCLRHSYAVEWGSKGASTGQIAKMIGDTEKVCRDRYNKYCATDDEIRMYLGLWSQK